MKFTEKEIQLRALREARFDSSRGGVRSKRLKTPAATGGIVPPVPPNHSQSVADDNGMAPAPEKLDEIYRKIRADINYIKKHYPSLIPSEEMPVKRGRPHLESVAKTLEARKPWLELGMSRRTWYNRQSEKRKES